MEKNGEIAFSPLLAAAQGGDEAALAELHRRYVPFVLRQLGRRPSILRRQYDTVDLSQSVFVEVLRDLRRFEDRGEAAFRKWLLLKAESKIRMKLRRRLNRNGGLREEALGEGVDSLRSGAAGPATRAGDAEEKDWLRGALRALDARDRRIVLLRTREGLAYGAIAERLKLGSADAVRMRFARALLAMRRRWPARA